MCQKTNTWILQINENKIILFHVFTFLYFLIYASVFG